MKRLHMLAIVACVGLMLGTTLSPAIAGTMPAGRHSLVRAASLSGEGPSEVAVVQEPDGSFQYLINGEPQTFIGMGYNPIYRDESDEERAARYDRDFQLLCEAGVNHITGWDADKGYEQDKFDEVTLDHAERFGIGVVMPLNLLPEADYTDESVREGILAEAREKVLRFRDHPALRMWGVGNEVLSMIQWPDQWAAFLQFYLQLIDLFHEVDPNHPVIYREAEDIFVPMLAQWLRDNGPERPWFIYGMNVYSVRLPEIIDLWPSYEFNRPLLVTEFGAEPDAEGEHANGYVEMWEEIRSQPAYVLGGAPYVWWTDGPEPTDLKWGLMDAESKPVDDTFPRLKAQWQLESLRNQTCAL